jgi:hypothetical protein
VEEGTVYGTYLPAEKNVHLFVRGGSTPAGIVAYISVKIIEI